MPIRSALHSVASLAPAEDCLTSDRDPRRALVATTSRTCKRIVGRVAAAASAAIEASAYTIGNSVAFVSSPDLHTAAHEAAHVVQQRNGVHVSGGIDGGAKDPFERHADAVADAVGAGKSRRSDAEWSRRIDGLDARGSTSSANGKRERPNQGKVRASARRRVVDDYRSRRCRDVEDHGEAHARHVRIRRCSCRRGQSEWHTRRGRRRAQQIPSPMRPTVQLSPTAISGAGRSGVGSTSYAPKIYVRVSRSSSRMN